MRASTFAFACLLISVLFVSSCLGDSYWEPTKDDLKVVDSALLIVRLNSILLSSTYHKMMETDRYTQILDSTRLFWRQVPRSQAFLG